MNTIPFKILELQQSTDEWREWRHNGIGASDAPVIMGENPWKNRSLLLHEKTHPATDGGQNAAMARGTLLEPEARKRYISKVGKEVAPACLESNLYTWQKASVDGISADFINVVEIKCGESVYKKTAQYRTVPSHYYGQLQHILAVTEINSIDFWCYLPSRPELHLQIPRNEEYIKRLIEAELNFWNEVQKKKI